MLFGDVNNKLLNKLNSMESFNHENIVLVSVIMEGNVNAIIGINTRRGDYRSAKIATNILENIGIVSDVGLSINIESVLIIFVESRFDFFKGLAQTLFHKIEESQAKRVAEEIVIEMLNGFPRRKNTTSPLGNEGMNMRIPLKATTESV